MQRVFRKNIKWKIPGTQNILRRGELFLWLLTKRYSDTVNSIKSHNSHRIVIFDIRIYKALKDIQFLIIEMIATRKFVAKEQIVFVYIKTTNLYTELPYCHEKIICDIIIAKIDSQIIFLGEVLEKIIFIGQFNIVIPKNNLSDMPKLVSRRNHSFRIFRMKVNY